MLKSITNSKERHKQNPPWPSRWSSMSASLLLASKWRWDAWSRSNRLQLHDIVPSYVPTSILGWHVALFATMQASVVTYQLALHQTPNLGTVRYQSGELVWVWHVHPQLPLVCDTACKSHAFQEMAFVSWMHWKARGWCKHIVPIANVYYWTWPPHPPHEPYLITKPNPHPSNITPRTVYSVYHVRADAKLGSCRINPAPCTLSSMTEWTP